MARFVLVHGSGQNAGCWSRVAALLEERGHAVAAPDLPKRESTWGLERYASRIAESVAGPDAVVVAHSFCGALLPLLHAARPCGLLVFLAAVIPEPGKSVRDQFAKDPSMFSGEWIAAGARWFEESQRESLAREFLFHDCDAETLPWALGTVKFTDVQKAIVEPAPFAKWPSVPVASIVASGDRTLSPAWIRRRSLEVSGRCSSS